MAASPIDAYRRQIERELQAGDATEHTHLPGLKALIESLAPELTATNEPKRGFGGLLLFSIEKPIARYPASGSNLVDNGFPKYVAPGEPEPGTGKPVKEGRVYINVAQSVSRRIAALPPRRAFGGAENARAAGKAAGLESEPYATGQYFEGVPREVWNFHIGGYQVCEEWLKDHRGRNLSFDELTHYQSIVTALKETIRLMAEIDAAIPK